MRAEQLQVALRPRPPWQAVELGTALLRQNAGAVWRPWLVASVPVFALVNALCWWLDHIWLAGVLMWWLLPLFDRVPVYVLSRAVFGQVPGLRETLAALPGCGRGQRAAQLLWRRLDPWRVQGLPVDVLEGGNAAMKRARRGLLVQGLRGVGVLVAWLCLGFALLLAFAPVLLVLLFVPLELLPDSARAVWMTLTVNPPRWAQVVLNVALWCGLSVVEPFHVGAGFGLYLNRRVHLEGWDIELALRGLHARLHRSEAGTSAAGMRAAVLAACLPLLAVAVVEPAAAQDKAGFPASTANRKSASKTRTAAQAVAVREPHTLAEVFSADGVADVAAFLRAVDAAGRDPLLHPYRTQQVWIPRQREAPVRLDQPEAADAAQSPLAQRLAVVGEGLLWLAAAALVLAIVLTAPRWWPWMRGHARRVAVPQAASVQVLAEAEPEPEPLPARIATHARALWQAGHRRQALALLYRGSIAALGERLRVSVSADATEAACLRLSRHLPEADARAAFAHLVGVWQRAAYAGMVPEDGEFAALADTLARQFGWPR